MHNSILGLERTRMNKGIGTHPQIHPTPTHVHLTRRFAHKGVSWFFRENRVVEFIKAQGETPIQPLNVSQM